MFLPRLQWDPRPTPHYVQEALLPLDLWVYLQEMLFICFAFGSSRYLHASSCNMLTCLLLFLLMLGCFVLPKILWELKSANTPCSWETRLAGLTLCHRARYFTVVFILRGKVWKWFSSHIYLVVCDLTDKLFTNLKPNWGPTGRKWGLQLYFLISQENNLFTQISGVQNEKWYIVKQSYHACINPIPIFDTIDTWIVPFTSNVCYNS